MGMCCSGETMKDIDFLEINKPKNPSGILNVNPESTEEKEQEEEENNIIYLRENNDNNKKFFAIQNFQKIEKQEIPNFFTKFSRKIYKENRKNIIDTSNLLNYEYEDGSIYFGEINSKNLKEGNGIIFWKDGSFYEGNLKDNKFNGFGRFVYSNGDFYEGNWKNGQVNGFGNYYSFDGANYSG